MSISLLERFFHRFSWWLYTVEEKLWDLTVRHLDLNPGSVISSVILGKKTHLLESQFSGECNGSKEANELWKCGKNNKQSTVTSSSLKLTPVGGSRGYLLPLVCTHTRGTSLPCMCALYSEFYSELIAPMSGADAKWHCHSL